IRGPTQKGEGDGRVAGTDGERPDHPWADDEHSAVLSVCGERTCQALSAAARRAEHGGGAALPPVSDRGASIGASQCAPGFAGASVLLSHHVGSAERGDGYPAA